MMSRRSRNAVAIADVGRDGEVRFSWGGGCVEKSMRQVVKRIAAKPDRAHFCYEAEPTGYGLHRLIPRLATVHRGGAVIDTEEARRSSEDQPA